MEATHLKCEPPESMTEVRNENFIAPTHVYRMNDRGCLRGIERL